MTGSIFSYYGMIWTAVVSFVPPTESFGILPHTAPYLTPARCPNARVANPWRMSRQRPRKPLLMQSLSLNSTDKGTAGILDLDASQHKIVVLEDVVSRLHEQKNQLTKELSESQARIKTLEDKLTETTKREQENASAAKKKYRAQIQELEEQIQAARDAQSQQHERTREKFETAKHKALAEHERLEAKAQTLICQLESAQSKLDRYRQESFERESEIRQRLRTEQQARKELEISYNATIAELEEIQIDMTQQEKKVEETLMISEAAVSAADRREARLQKALNEAEEKLASLQSEKTSDEGFEQMFPNNIVFPKDCEATVVHEHFMKLAIDEARQAASRNEVPIGAIVVRNITVEESDCSTFEILSTGQNAVETEWDASAHAELIALRRASKRIQNWRLLNCTLYSTLEPCPMCLSACQAFRLPRLVYGAPDLRLGAVETYLQLLEIDHPFHNVSVVAAGVMRDDCADMMRSFFRERREDGGASTSPQQQTVSQKVKNLQDALEAKRYNRSESGESDDTIHRRQQKPSLFRRISKKLMS